MADQPAAYGVRISAQPGHASIRLDDTELPQGQVTGYTLHHSITDALPTLVLHTRQPDGAVWEGLARVAVGVQQSPADVVRTFLASIDPVELDRAAMSRTDFGGGKAEVARAMLAVLADWAQNGDS
ncbi:hypothetical protein [Streptomyces sp. NPDC017529]|uniref:hypothetical protein n=1 Tax=Streptomyces sp. NPDC017529 TaxID=3365000 RepID=UPI0037B66C6D